MGGGVVRDLFLNRPLKEIDLMVVGDGIKFAKIIAKEMAIKKVVQFPKFSTAHIPAKPIPIEVAAAREETYDPDSRKPKQVIYTDLKGDPLRRDFTVNAMAMDISEENLNKDSNYVFASNHESALDILLVFAGLPYHIVFISKIESSTTVPGVTTRTTSLSTMPLEAVESLVCSQIATLCPSLTSFPK